MGFRMSDGFDAYAVSADVVKKWPTFDTTGWAFNATAGVFGGGAIVATSAVNAVLRPTFPTNTQLLGWNANANQGCLAFWLKVSATPAANTSLIWVWESNFNNFINVIRITTAGVFVLLDQNSGTVATGVTNVCDNNWHWIEMKIGPSTNHVSGSNANACVVDGITQWNATLTIGHGQIEQVLFQGIASRTVTIDDYLCYDSLGTGLMASAFPLGQLTCLTKWPNADSAVQFARSSGADNYALVDETVPSTADYVQSGTSGEQDLYDFPNLGFTPTSIKAVVLNAYMHNPNAGAISAKLIAKNGATQVDGTTIPVFTTPKYFQQHFDTDPNGAIAWTGGGFDSSKFGIKVA